MILTYVSLLASLLAIILSLYTLRLNLLERRIGETDDTYFAPPERTYICAACKKEFYGNPTEIQIDIPVNPESTVLLPINLEICGECASIGS